MKLDSENRERALVQRFSGDAAMTVPTARWQLAWQALETSAPAGLHAQLLARYAEPHRAYHTQQHLAECLALFDEV